MVYEIVSNGTVVGRAEKPDYITLNSPNGFPQETDAEHADCVSVCGKLYQLPGAAHGSADYPDAIVRPADEAKKAFAAETEAKEETVHLGRNVADLEAAALELADSVDATASGTEAAIAELSTNTEAALMEIGDMLAALVEQNGGN